jgi:small GTP-binding protein
MANPMEIKVCIIGDTDVGKTSLSTRYCHGEFPNNSTPTIGASFLQRRVVVDNTEISLQIWDTAGQERFRSMAPMYYRGAKAAICVFDVTNEESFNRVSTWLRDLKSHADPNVVICLAGNKCDKPATFDLAKCEALARSLGGVYFATSALTGEGVQEIFETLARRVAEVYRSNRGDIAKEQALKLGSDVKNMKKEQSGGCC